MPDKHLIGAGRDIADLKPAIFIGHRIVGILHGEPPAFHIGVEAALHDEHPSPLRHADELLHRFAGQVLVIHGGIAHVFQVSRMLRIHRQRYVEKHTRAKLEVS